MAADIYLDGNDYEIEKAVTTRAAATGVEQAAGGLTLTGHVSATDGGAAIHASLSVSLAERASESGTYAGVLQGADIDTHLTAYAGQYVWIVAGDGSNLQVSDRVRVVSSRRSA